MRFLGRIRRKSSTRRAVAGTLATVSLVGVGMGSAWASQTAPTSANLTLTGKAQFTGKFSFYSRNDHHGGFRIAVGGGTLKDINNNNRSVKFQVKVNGYAASTYTAPEDGSRSIPDRVHYDPASTITTNGYYRNCQNNTVTPDDCNDWRHKRNPYS